MRDELLRSTKLFVDETTAPVLEPWCGRTPPAVVYSYAPRRSGEHAAALLRGYSGVRQTDGYAAYRSLADPKRVGGPVTLAFCWAHWRRQWFDLAKSPPAPIATEAVKRIAELYQIEAEIRGKSARGSAAEKGRTPRRSAEDLARENPGTGRHWLIDRPGHPISRQPLGWAGALH
jgi:transposase